MRKILLINGPNLNLLGKREPKIYGFETLTDIIAELQNIANKSGYFIDAQQSNHEGEIVTMLQKSYIDNNHVAIMINAAAYTHSSIAILDSLKLFSIPIFEIHLSDPKQREEFRHFSYIEQVAYKIFKGEGKNSYIKALETIIDLKL